MSKISSAKYCQENKERLQKMLLKDIKIFRRKKKKNINYMVIVAKISQRMKSKSLLRIEKKSYRMKKTLYHNHEKLLLKNIMT